jgi:Domain of unknown function (DUF222)
MGERIDDLIGVARAAVDQVLSELTTIDISGSTVKELRSLLDRVELGTTFAYNRFRESGDFLLDGYANGPAWLAANTNALRGEGHARKDQAELLDLLGSFGDSFHRNRIGYIQIKTLASVVSEERRPLAVRDEQVLLEAAEALTASEFKTIVRRWVSLCDDELSDPTKPDAHAARRRVTLTVLPDGSWKLDGILEPLAGEALQAALTAVMPSKPLPDDDRSTVQKRHDALHDIANEILGTDEVADGHGSRPNVTVTLNGEKGTTTTASGTVLPRWVRDAMCCDATFTAVFLSGNGVPFDVGTPITGIPIRNRRNVLARDRHCRYPGCSHPPRWCDIHHLKHREHGGDHAINNMALLCRFHHRLVHAHGLKLTMAPDDITLLIEWPNGITLHSPPTTQLTLAG